ncbi:MAG: formylmethanofuran dehydrogenase subunit E family protein [Candidatus Bathyarchaeota archaeon]|nr:formylmethanofuran dehydrogenase subunit E family protein [Candidatus Bathyarchaeota archaeon]
MSRAVKVHGHRGPFLALGIRASIEASRRLGGIDLCIVSCPQVKPYLCILDGIRTILPDTIVEVRESSSGLKIMFRSDKSVLSLSVRKEILERYLGRSWDILPILADEVLSMGFHDLFDEESIYGS